MYKELRCTGVITRDASADPHSNQLYVQGTTDEMRGPRLQPDDSLLSPAAI